MNPTIKTIPQIIADLEASPGGRWKRIPHLFGMTVPEVLSDGKVNFVKGEKGIVLAAFMSLDTAEVRFYVAKYTDIENREDLFKN